MNIIWTTPKPVYMDMNESIIEEGDVVLLDGEEKVVYLTDNDQLGVDATNPAWIKSGRAEPCDFGIYPFDAWDEPVIVKKHNKV